MTRRRLATVGMRGASAIVFAERLTSGNDLVRVQWREAGRLHTRSWPLSAEGKRIARAFAEGTVERLQRRGVRAEERLTVRAVFDRYLAARTPEWREKTRVTTVTRWRVFTNLVSPATFADLVTPETLDEVRVVLRRRYAPNQVAHVVQLVKSVWKLARARRWIPENSLEGYENRLAKDERPTDVPEYTPEEVGRILGALDYRKAREWRLWVAVQLASLLGPRQRSLFGLELGDVDLTARVVHWRPELDKRAKERWQPLPRDAVFAVRVALVWRARLGYRGPYLLPPVQERRQGPWVYQAAVEMLHSTCRRVGVPVVKHRAFHGFRRHAARNVLGLTGSIKAAGDWIGDDDVRTLTRSYLKRRPEEQREIANALSSPRAARAKESRTDNRPGNQVATGAAEESVSA